MTKNNFDNEISSKERLRRYLGDYKPIIRDNYDGKDKGIINDILEEITSMKLNTAMAMIYVIGYRRGYSEAIQGNSKSDSGKSET